MYHCNFCLCSFITRWWWLKSLVQFSYQVNKKRLNASSAKHMLCYFVCLFLLIWQMVFIRVFFSSSSSFYLSHFLGVQISSCWLLEMCFFHIAVVMYMYRTCTHRMFRPSYIFCSAYHRFKHNQYFHFVKQTQFVSENQFFMRFIRFDFVFTSWIPAFD